MRVPERPSPGESPGRRALNLFGMEAERQPPASSPIAGRPRDWSDWNGALHDAIAAFQDAVDRASRQTLNETLADVLLSHGYNEEANALLHLNGGWVVGKAPTALLAGQPQALVDNKQLPACSCYCTSTDADTPSIAAT